MASKSVWIRDVEWQLYNYPVHRQLVEQYTRNYEELPSPVSHMETSGIRARGYASKTEKEALRLTNMAEKIASLRWYVEAVDDILPILSETERYILENRYFAASPKAVWQIANDIYMSRSEYYRHRDILLAKFGRRFGII